jgi:hypothetical protein
MGEKLGMDVEEARAKAALLTAQLGVLERAAATVSAAVSASTAPLLPGAGPVLAAPSIVSVAQAERNIALASAAIVTMTKRLYDEAMQQEVASSASDVSYKKGWLPKVKDPASVKHGGILHFLGGIAHKAGEVLHPLDTAEHIAEPLLKDSEDLLAAAAEKLEPILHSRLAEALGFVGIGIGVYNTYEDIKKGQVMAAIYDGTETVLSAGITAGELGVAALAGPELAIAAVGVTVAYETYKHPRLLPIVAYVVFPEALLPSLLVFPGIRHGVADVGRGVAHGVDSAGHAVVHVTEHAGTTVEHAAGSVLHVAKHIPNPFG